MNFSASRRITMGLAATLIVIGGCNSPQSNQGTAGSSAQVAKSEMPNLGLPMQDVRTEATIQEMELWYNATKNSQPTHQREAEAEAAKKAKAKQLEAEKKAEKTNP